MKIKKIVVGDLKANCYILENNNNILIIDPGAEGCKIKKNISGNVVGIITTHSHPDHIGEVDYLKNVYKCKVFNMNNLKEGINNIYDFSFNIIYTPGHLTDEIVIYFTEEKMMFTGDFIFKGTIGRTDLPGGSDLEMKKSIEKILKYDDDILIYPGHYEDTFLKNERRMLEYFKMHL